MKLLQISFLCLFVFSSCSSSPAYEVQEEISSEDHGHHDHNSDISNNELAKKLGADEYGMRQYVMAFLKAGPNRSQSEQEAQELQKAHLNNISRMAEEGELVLAGPFMDDGDLRGIYIFDVRTIEEAVVLTQSDPMIQSGRLIMEMHPWYGSAAIMQVNEVHNKIQSISISTN